ncbi:MAG: flagellar hook-length control protein FliK [Rhodocyclaceae bacterium]|nr:flagellar hook-length control protein FliK [Rhodocyclaceae bacterium]
MSALSVPNILSAQAKPPAQTSNAQPEADTPFSSVLQQKVQSNKEGGNVAKAQDQPATQPAQAANAETPPEKTASTDQESAAAAVVNGDNAQAAMQQLLPWLQALQGKEAKVEVKESSEATTNAQIPTIAIGGSQQRAATGARQTPPRETPAEAAAGEELPAAAKESATASTATAAAAANLAATVDTSSDAKHKPAPDSFDAALQGANQRVEAQMQQTNAPHGTTESRTQDSNRLQAPLGSSQWQQEFTDRIQLMSRHNEGRAELVLTPPQLGRIEVTLNINGDQASAMFVSASPEVRTALEGAMDRLREALANNGIALGQAHVGAESSGQSADNRGGNSQRGGQIAANAVDTGTVTTAWTRHSNSMLDVFA